MPENVGEKTLGFFRFPLHHLIEFVVQVLEILLLTFHDIHQLFFCMQGLKIKNCNFREQTVKLDTFVCRILVEMPAGIHEEFCCRLLYY